MPGAMRKLGLYLGLVEDDDLRDDHYDRSDRSDRYDRDDRARDRPDDEDDYDEPEAVRGRGRDPVVARRSLADARGRGSVALDPGLRAAPAAAHDDPYRITTLHPRTYNEARTIGEQFREGTPVIMNLTEMDDNDAKRLVDFAAGLVFAVRGTIERVTAKVFLLSPPNVTVSTEDKERIAENGFFNQS